MSVSDIAVTALTAVATVKGNALTITTSDPRNGALPNIALDRVDIYASQTDTFASASVVTQGTLRALHADAGDEQTWYYWGIPYDKIGGAGTRYPSGATGGVSCTSLGQAGIAFGLSNGMLVASVAANALTIAIKTAAGNDPSATDRVAMAFRSATATTGGYQILQITAATSLVISSGSTLGSSNDVPFRVWVVLFADGTTARLGAVICTSAFVIGSLAEHNLTSSTAEGGAGAADSVGTIYTGTAVSSKPMRILGFLDWSSGLVAAGTWSVGPDLVNLFSLGMKGPGDTVAYAAIPKTSTQSGTTTIPFDDTVPQISEGVALDTLVATGGSPINILELKWTVNVTHSVGGPVFLALFKNGAADAIASVWGSVPSADAPVQITIETAIQFGASPVTINLRGGSSVAGTFYRNRLNAGTKLGSTLTSVAVVKERMA